MSKNEGVFLKLTSALVLDGDVVPAGSLVEVTQAEAKNFLHRRKAVLATEHDTPLALRQDGPTVAEYVAAGYSAANYPPAGYAPRSSETEILAAVEAEAAAEAADAPPPAADDDGAEGAEQPAAEAPAAGRRKGK